MRMVRRVLCGTGSVEIPGVAALAGFGHFGWRHHGLLGQGDTVMRQWLTNPNMRVRCTVSVQAVYASHRPVWRYLNTRSTVSAERVTSRPKPAMVSQAVSVRTIKRIAACFMRPLYLCFQQSSGWLMPCPETPPPPLQTRAAFARGANGLRRGSSRTSLAGKAV